MKTFFQILFAASTMATVALSVGADAWDPADDAVGNATVLQVSSSVQAHGPHSVGGAGDRQDWFRVYLHGRASYNFNTTGGTGDTVGELYDSSGTNLVASNDDVGTDLMFNLGYTPGVSGWYLLKVRSFSSSECSYSLNYSGINLPDAWDPGDNTREGATDIASPISMSVTVSGHSIGTSDDQEDWYRIYLDGYGRYGFGTTGISGLQISVFHTNGTQIWPVASPRYVAPEDGYYFIRVSLTSASYGPGAYALTTVRIATAAPDLVLDSADFSPNTPDEVQPGDALDAKWTVSGPSTGSTQVYLELFASKTGGFDLERLGGTVTNSAPIAHVGLGRPVVYKAGDYYAPQEQYVRDQFINQIPDGNYTLVGAVNRLGSAGVEEAAYTNNFAVIPGKRLFVHNPATPVADLTWQAPPTISIASGVATVSGVVTNSGSGASPAYGFWTEIWSGSLNAEGVFTPIGFHNGQHIGRLAPGATANYSATVPLPPGATAVAAFVDSTCLVPELDESNNYAVEGTPPPTSGSGDLEILFASISSAQLAPAELSPGGTLTWTCTVRNNAASDSGPVWFELFPSTTGGLDHVRCGITLTASEQRSVAAGQTEVFTFTQPLNAITDGIYSVAALVNRSGIDGPAETDYRNNRLVLPGRVFLHNSTSAGANLVWSAGPTVTSGGGSITISGTLQNTGTAPTGPFWTESFRGSFDVHGTYTEKVALGSGSHSAGLAPGATLAYSQTFPLPSGNPVLGVLTDSTDIVPELDESDNYDYLLP